MLARVRFLSGRQWLRDRDDGDKPRMTRMGTDKAWCTNLSSVRSVQSVAIRLQFSCEKVELPASIG